MSEGKRKFLRRDIFFLAVIFAVVSLLAVLSLTGKKRFISRTSAHLAVAAIEENASADAVCISCHAMEEGVSTSVDSAGPALPQSHPLRKKNCRQCHRLERVKK